MKRIIQLLASVLAIVSTTCCFSVSIANAQTHQEIKIVAATQTIAYQEKKEGEASISIRQVPIDIEYWSDASDGNLNKEIKFDVVKTSSPNSNPIIKLNPCNIKAADFSKTHQHLVINVPIQISASTFTAPEIFTIGLQGYSINDPYITVTIQKNATETVDPIKYDANSEFWVEGGTNLDLVDGPKVGNVTAGIFFHMKDKGSLCEKKTNNLSLFTGIYETKSVSKVFDHPYSYEQYLTNRSFVSGRSDSAKWFGYFSSQRKVTTIRNWSFFFSPQIRFGSGNLTDGKPHISVSAWFEYQFQEMAVDNSFSSLQLIDSGFVKREDIKTFKQIDTTSNHFGIATHFEGIGFPIYYETSVVQVIVNPVFGGTNQLKFQELGYSYSGQPCWRPFYLVQFRISEKNLGITLTGEVRGLISSYSPPVYTLALTKKFNLAKLLQYPL